MNKTKLQNFLQIIDDMNIEIACVCESWFDSEKGVFSKTIKDAGLQLHHAFREQKKGGGVAIIYKNNLKVKKGGASTSFYSSFEFFYITITLQSKKTVLVVCVYRKQEILFTNFIEQFS